MALSIIRLEASPLLDHHARCCKGAHGAQSRQMNTQLQERCHSTPLDSSLTDAHRHQLLEEQLAGVGDEHLTPGDVAQHLPRGIDLADAFEAEQRARAENATLIIPVGGLGQTSQQSVWTAPGGG